jgi:hypothetical protein
LTAIEALAIVAPASIGGRAVVFRGARSRRASLLREEEPWTRP